MSLLDDRLSQMTPLQRAVLALKETQAQLEQLQRARSEPIAILGLGCRFPGDADTPEAFWRLLAAGADAITEVPPDRWDLAAYYDPDPAAPGKMSTRHGGFLSRVDGFDAEFHGIAPREALRLDPQQRLLLEVAWEALERAGLPPERLAGSQTGVFIGISSDDYRDLQGGNPAEIDAYTGTGAAYSVAAGRLSYLLGLHGPCFPVDTACSSALVAVHLACQSLRAGECDLALAGGVNLILSPERMVYFSKLRALAPDGRCKTFDARADGYVRGEGCGVVVLKRLSEAQRDGDPIWAVVRGSAVNHDGRSNGLTAPNGLAQQAVIRAALAQAGVAPAAVGYVEAHGTGTALGDPIEVQALAAVLGAGRPASQPLFVGSVKTNLGHLEAAAGMAGLIKTVLALQHQAIPAHLHFQTPSPHIPWADLPVSIPTVTRPWPAAQARLAGVSAFGLSGTNAHLVLEAAPPPAVTSADQPSFTEPFRLLPLSARTPAALRALAERYAVLLADPSAPSLAAVAAAAGSGRSHFAYRAALLAVTAADAQVALRALADGHSHPALHTGLVAAEPPAPRVVFVCAGQGGQWAGMAQALWNDPLAVATFQRVAQAAPPDLGWSLLAVLADPAAPWLERIDQLQPLLFALQLALAARLQAWGLLPAALIGHSFGEVAAAYLAGVLELPEAMRVICARSRALAQRRGRGTMALVELPAAQVQAAIGAHTAQVTIAALNGPRSTVLTGDGPALDHLVAELSAQGVFARRLAVDVAAHSPQLDALLPALARELADLQPHPAKLPFYSTVTGRLAAGAELGAAYWADNLRAPVQFWPALQALAADEHTHFIELGPHPTLLTALGDGLRALGVAGQALPSLRRDRPAAETLLTTLGALYCAGVPVAWRQVAGRPPAAAALPTYPFQRERYWVTPAASARWSPLAPLAAQAHPLLGRPQSLAPAIGRQVWTQMLEQARLPYLADHQVGGLAVLPGSAYVEMMLAAGASPEAGAELSAVTFARLLALPAEQALELQTVLTAGGGSANVEVWSRPLAADAAWTRHASGTVLPLSAPPAAPETLAALQARCVEALDVPAYYAQLAEQGLAYGPRLRLLAALWRRPGEALARLSLPPAVAADLPRYRLHPALLDAGFQVLGAALAQGDASLAADLDPALPVGFDQLRCAGPLAGELWVHCRLIPSDDPAIVRGDLCLRDASGQRIVEVQGLRAQRLTLGERRRPSAAEDWLYQLEWQRRPLAASADAPVGAAGAWIILADGGGLGRAVAAQLSAGGGHGALVTPGPAYARLERGRYQLDPADPRGYRQLLRDLQADGYAPGRGLLHLWGLDLTSPGTLLPDSVSTSCLSVAYVVQALAQAGWRDVPRLWLVTRGAQALAPDEAPAVAQSPLWGLARALTLEHAELTCTCVDLDPAADLAASAGALCRLVAEASRENQLALRGGQLHVARLVHSPGPAPAPRPAVAAPAGAQPFRLELARPGVLDDLRWRAFTPPAPGRGQVVIQVTVAGLNFLDVLSALGARPDHTNAPLPLGAECAGTIVALGPDVTELRVGDPVVAIAAASFGTHVLASAALVARRPAGLSDTEAATLPIAFVTAYYALCHVGRLRPGERVLIHAATGGTGLAAVAVARWVGAEVYAMAGSPAKRQYLHDLGLTHVFDSRSLAFAGGVLAATAGRGVDVVLNTLTGAGLAKSLEVLASHGRCLDISKKDIYEDGRLPLAAFRRNLTYSAIDLARMVAEQPELCGELLREVLRLISARQLPPLPAQSFPPAEVVDAFRAMAQARHIGKLVITFNHAAQTPIWPATDERPDSFRADGAYLLTGGLGGLGLKLAEWLVARGARRLALLGRSAPSDAAAQ
ncbi:MAG: acyltransferase domain-containing protein, partial [Anaerolineales bacterium]|nr:acyltransferase domain-containing protein [Anaerolineales bacterium]